MRVAFLLQDLQLSGGVGVVVEHARRLRAEHGVDAQLVLTRAADGPAWPYNGLEDVPVRSREDACAERWDIAVASWWETTGSLFDLDADRYAYFVQLLEDSAYEPGAAERIGAMMSTALPVALITEARWIAEILEDYQRGSHVRYVRNGIAKQTFRSPEAVTPSLPGAPLRVVVEGSAEYVQKGVAQALEVTALMHEPAHVTWVSPHPVEPPDGVDEVLSGLSHAEMASLFARHDVLLKLPRAEGMYGPPLEAFHMGCTVVTSPVTGHDEYVRHGVNGLVCGWDDVHGTARMLDLLARDRCRLHQLRCAALETARAWPDWAQSSQLMAVALRQIASEPPPSVRGAGRRLVSDIQSASAEYERQAWRVATLWELDAELRGQRAVRVAFAARRRLDRVRGRWRGLKARLRR